MPIHEYKCADCGEINEFLVGIGRNSDELVCRGCGGSHLEALISAAASSSRFHLPGSAPGDSWWGKTAPQKGCQGKGCRDKS
ncbi:MAG: zinc ribbon domain-containing protein [Desulfomonile tiedjei]|nr:zinc ribbon domain-containing protein [Desulfomonile tiedjei]